MHAFPEGEMMGTMEGTVEVVDADEECVLEIKHVS